MRRPPRQNIANYQRHVDQGNLRAAKIILATAGPETSPVLIKFAERVVARLGGKAVNSDGDKGKSAGNNEE